MVGLSGNRATNGASVTRATLSHGIQNSLSRHVLSSDGKSTAAYSSSASSRIENSELQSIDTAMATVHSDDFFTPRRMQTHGRPNLPPETAVPSKHYDVSHEIQLLDGYFENDSGVPSVSSDDESRGPASRNTHERDHAREVKPAVAKASRNESMRTRRQLSRCRELRRKDWDKKY